MTSWQSLPTELQLRDIDMVSLTLQEVEELFTTAAKLGVVEQFSEVFWEAMHRVRDNPTSATMQKCVNFIEERKRTLGRCYDISKMPEIKEFFAIRYNEAEYCIRWLIDQYDCERKSKPYLMEV